MSGFTRGTVVNPILADRTGICNRYNMSDRTVWDFMLTTEK